MLLLLNRETAVSFRRTRLKNALWLVGAGSHRTEGFALKSVRSFWPEFKRPVKSAYAIPARKYFVPGARTLETI